MFYNDNGIILDIERNSFGTIQMDFQPYEKILQYEDEIEIEITNRMFCDKNEAISEEVYIEVNNNLYRIMKIKIWSDYLECWLYPCEDE